MNTPNKYLQFEDPTVLKFNFQVNDNFDFEGEIDDTDISTLVEMPSQSELDFSDEIPVYLTVFINYENNNSPYKITTRIFSLFKVSQILEPEDALQILQTEGASILLSYLRPIVSMMTASSGFEAMTLPMLDFSDEED
ncbi:protein-export chaperone SecB [Companilactobacillus musae]|nr:protein-export chaperone SecB [Companilactobacillus musae]